MLLKDNNLIVQGTSTNLQPGYISLDRVEFRRNLYMNDQRIFLHTNHNFFLKYLSNTYINGVELAGYGGDDTDSKWAGYLSYTHASSNTTSQSNAICVLRWKYGKVKVEGSIDYQTGTLGSDDRFKTNEIPLTNCLSTILKLEPEIYTKTAITQQSRNIGECPTYIDENGETQNDYDNWPSEIYTITQEPFTESGFIAQDTYNNIPELRHLINIEKQALDNPNNFNENGNLVENVVDNNGDASYLSINYNGIIPYLVGAIKELNTTVQAQATLINNLQNQVNSLLNQ